MDTTCCYAVHDKFWVTDLDGNEWEHFHTKHDAEENLENSKYRVFREKNLIIVRENLYVDVSHFSICYIYHYARFSHLAAEKS